MEYVGLWQTGKNRHTTKLEVPSYLFNGEKYPDFLSGAGYLLSRNTATCLYEEGKKLPYVNLEVSKVYCENVLNVFLNNNLIILSLIICF